MYYEQTNHYKPILNLVIACGTDGYCIPCNKSHWRVKEHRCSKKCYKCFLSPPCSLTENLIECNNCLRLFFGNIYLNNHTKIGPYNRNTYFKLWNATISPGARRQREKSTFSKFVRCTSDISISCEICGIREYVFDHEPIKQLDDFALAPRARFQQVICIAHNSQGFDAQFIFKYVVEKFNQDQVAPLVVMNSSKIILMEVLRTKFIDS
ncbi:hypothetical protein TSAR_009483 [Trichomalopsis sarcophagae]|uniref:DNA-directed DNA polymerase n=1 Tax=Trichomalopsis sarcophagae TaxID=543379 RepID=A0A232FGX5_9HYME|nr:hypothetical protein TSAR_009483 [Trichomalopsis sarcophagae]